MRACGYRPSEKVADTGRMWTKSIWDNIPWDQINAGEREGWTFFDDFINMPALSELDVDYAKYAVYQDTGGTNTLGQGPDSEYGELAIVLSGTDNEEGWIQTGGNLGGMGNFMLQSAGVPHTLAFECRAKKSAIATGSMFVGFAQQGLAAADAMYDNSGTIADVDYLGFHTPEADPDGVDWAYNKASGGTDQIIIPNADTIVANIYAKWGFIYNYKNAAARQIKCYIDGVLQSTFITKALIDDTTEFPGGEEMGLLFGGKVGSSATAHTMTMDWWRAALVVNA